MLFLPLSELFILLSLLYRACLLSLLRPSLLLFKLLLQLFLTLLCLLRRHFRVDCLLTLLRVRRSILLPSTRDILDKLHGMRWHRNFVKHQILDEILRVLWNLLFELRVSHHAWNLLADKVKNVCSPDRQATPMIELVQLGLPFQGEREPTDSNVAKQFAVRCISEEYVYGGLDGSEAIDVACQLRHLPPVVHEPSIFHLAHLRAFASQSGGRLLQIVPRLISCLLK